MSEKYAIGDSVVEAVYDQTGTRNPLIEALPSRLPPESFFESMRSFPVLGEKSEILPCYLAPSSSRYDGYDHSDVSVIKNVERVKRMDAREKELSAKVDMYREIQKIVEQAEAKREEITELGDISQHRDAERSRLI